MVTVLAVEERKAGTGESSVHSWEILVRQAVESHADFALRVEETGERLLEAVRSRISTEGHRERSQTSTGPTLELRETHADSLGELRAGWEGDPAFETALRQPEKGHVICIRPRSASGPGASDIEVYETIRFLLDDPTQVGSALQSYSDRLSHLFPEERYQIEPRIGGYPDEWPVVLPLGLQSADAIDGLSPGGDSEGAIRRLAITSDRQADYFSKFVLRENERLNRLIRNLYLHFQLEHYNERELFDHICQEVADYFRADCCALYLIQYEEAEIPASPDRRDRKSGETRRVLRRWLEMAGAAGPWRRALRQQYSRERSRPRYQLRGAAKLEHCDDPEQTPEGMTTAGFYRDAPVRYASGYDFRAQRRGAAEASPSSGQTAARREDAEAIPEHSGRLVRESPRQVVWYQDGLFNSCRSSIIVSLIREGNADASQARAPEHRRIGLLKVENRAPSHIPGYSDVPPKTGARKRVFFEEEWKFAALRPYVRDLEESRDAFLPIHNNVGWQQYFDDHPSGAEYFKRLMERIRQASEAPNREDQGRRLRMSYRRLGLWLEGLVEALNRAESWLQHLESACLYVCGAQEEEQPPSLDRPTPSLFNAYNLRAAFHETQETQILADGAAQGEGAADQPAASAGSIQEAVRVALLRCLARGRAALPAEREQRAEHQADGDEGREVDILQRLSALITAGDDMQRLLAPAKAERPQARRLDHLLEELQACWTEVQNLTPTGIEDLKAPLERLLSPQFEPPRDGSEGEWKLWCSQAGGHLTLALKLVRDLNRKRIEELAMGKKNLLRDRLAHRDADDASSPPNDAGDDRPLPRFTIEDCLESEPPDWNLRAMILGVIEDMEGIAADIWEAVQQEDMDRYRPQARSPGAEMLAMVAEEAAVRHIVKTVRAFKENNVDLLRKFGADCPHDPAHGTIAGGRSGHAASGSSAQDPWVQKFRQSYENVERVGCRAARMHAAATMYADSFHVIDEPRLKFIAGHVAQVIEGHLLHQAGQRGLEVPYRVLAAFALDQHGIELLDRFQSALRRVVPGLAYLLGRGARRENLEARLTISDRTDPERSLFADWMDALYLELEATSGEEGFTSGMPAAGDRSVAASARSAPLPLVTIPLPVLQVVFRPTPDRPEDPAQQLDPAKLETRAWRIVADLLRELERAAKEQRVGVEANLEAGNDASASISLTLSPLPELRPGLAEVHWPLVTLTVHAKAAESSFAKGKGEAPAEPGGAVPNAAQARQGPRPPPSQTDPEATANGLPQVGIEFELRFDLDAEVARKRDRRVFWVANRLLQRLVVMFEAARRRQGSA